jgi:hypothetical protein
VASTSQTAAAAAASYARAVMQFDAARLGQLRKRIESMRAEKTARELANNQLLAKAQTLMPTKEEKLLIEGLLKDLEKSNMGATMFDLIKNGDERGFRLFGEFMESHHALVRRCEQVGPILEALILVVELRQARDNRERAWRVAEQASTAVPATAGKYLIDTGKELGRWTKEWSASLSEAEAGELGNVAASIEAIGSDICIGVAIGKGVVYLMRYYVESWNEIIVKGARREARRLNMMLRQEVADETRHLAWLQGDIDKLQATVNDYQTPRGAKSDRGGYYNEFYYFYCLGRSCGLIFNGAICLRDL